MKDAPITQLLRGMQMLFAATAFVFSVFVAWGLVKDNPTPAFVSYSIVCGFGCFLMGLWGWRDVKKNMLSGQVSFFLDLITAIFLLVAGIIFAAKIRAGSCGDVSYLSRNIKIFAGSHANKTMDEWEPDVFDDAKYGCMVVQTDVAALFLGGSAFLATMVITCWCGSTGGSLP